MTQRFYFPIALWLSPLLNHYTVVVVHTNVSPNIYYISVYMKVHYICYSPHRMAMKGESHRFCRSIVMPRAPVSAISVNLYK